MQMVDGEPSINFRTPGRAGVGGGVGRFSPCTPARTAAPPAAGHHTPRPSPQANIDEGRGMVRHWGGP